MADPGCVTVCVCVCVFGTWDPYHEHAHSEVRYAAPAQRSGQATVGQVKQDVDVNICNMCVFCQVGVIFILRTDVRR